MGSMTRGTNPSVRCCPLHDPARSHNAVASFDSIAVFGCIRKLSSTLNHAIMPPP
ncbi:hypothetical protein [Bifidobacterium pullorum]|uniref:hypothetical protein n=1 Tax=Bifidobacterium pullorum TaxID=78448 RepID=UPI0024313787|nr:hypothetical protein [Bifidobacterium pullorum]